MIEEIILVDEKDNEIGFGEKLNVHKLGLLHRAFSMVIFNDKNNMLIQKKAENKYHCPGLWSNACCSHQRKNEFLEDAVHRRLKEEMGFDTELNRIFSFHYAAKFNNGLIENEIDHVFLGKYDKDPIINGREVSEYNWIDYVCLKKDVLKNPSRYTVWFRMIVERLK